MNTNYLSREKLLSLVNAKTSKENPAIEQLVDYLEAFETDRLIPKDNTHVINFESHLQAIHEVLHDRLKRENPHVTFEIEASNLTFTDMLMREFSDSIFEKDKRIKLIEILLWLHWNEKIEIIKFKTPHKAAIKIVDLDYFKNDFENEEVEEMSWVTFDEKTNCLVADTGRECEIPHASNQAIVCRKIFSIPEESWLKSIEIIDDLFTSSNSAFYNTVREINKKSLECFGVKVLEYATEKARVRPEIMKQDTS